eukprot:gene2080-2566_t
MSLLSLRVRSKAGVENIKVEILYGFPPKALDTSNLEAIISSFISSGDTITVENTSSSTTSSSASTTTTTTPPPQPVTNTSNSNNNNKTTTSTSINNQPKPVNNTNNNIEDDIDGFVVRRYTDDDNSCLFSSVGYVLENKRRQKASELRQIIANAVKSDPFTFNEGVLGQPTDGYYRWILNTKNWGGAIELSILSQHYRVEIAAFDISTKIMYCYGEDQHYSDRVYLIYDGIHYDALSICPIEEGPEEFDQTLFSTKDTRTMNKMKSFIDRLNREGKFTDTTLKGEKEAALHASQTGHGNFTEYKK